MGFKNTPTDEVTPARTDYYPRKSHLGHNLIIAALSLFLIAVLLLFAWITGKTTAENTLKDKIGKLESTLQEKDDKIAELTNQPAVVTPVSPTIDLQFLRNRIEGISELATVEYLFTDSAMFSNSKHFIEWSVPFTEKSFILKWDGTIKAGVDLSQVELRLLENTSTDENSVQTIAVYMPAAEILSYEVDESSVEVLTESSPIFNPITVSDKVSFDAATKDSMKTRAIENGLLEKAKTNAEEILSQLILFDSEIEKNYTVRFFVKH